MVTVRVRGRVTVRVYLTKGKEMNEDRIFFDRMHESDAEEPIVLTPISGDCALEYEASGEHMSFFRTWLRDAQSDNPYDRFVVAGKFHGFGIGCGFSGDAKLEIYWLGSVALVGEL